MTGSIIALPCNTMNTPEFSNSASHLLLIWWAVGCVVCSAYGHDAYGHDTFLAHIHIVLLFLFVCFLNDRAMADNNTVLSG